MFLKLETVQLRLGIFRGLAQMPLLIRCWFVAPKLKLGNLRLSLLYWQGLNFGYILVANLPSAGTHFPSTHCPAAVDGTHLPSTNCPGPCPV